MYCRWIVLCRLYFYIGKATHCRLSWLRQDVTLFTYLLSSLTVMSIWTCSEVLGPLDGKPETRVAAAVNKTSVSRLTEVVLSALSAEAVSLNSAAAAAAVAAAEGSHEKWMCETYGQDSAWINDEGMNPGPSRRRSEKIHQALLEFPPIKRWRKVGQFSKLIPSQFKMWSLWFPGGLQGLPYNHVHSVWFYYIL